MIGRHTTSDLQWRRVKDLKIDRITKKYYVRILDSKDIDAVYELCSKNRLNYNIHHLALEYNRLYYQYCPPFITRDGVIEDMEALPPGKKKCDKYFLGYFENDLLIAVLDLIVGYPDISTYYIGLFMMYTKIQGKGEGTKIITKLCAYFQSFPQVSILCIISSKKLKG